MRNIDRERGLRLRAIREALGYSQTQICRVTGIKQSTWNNWENKGYRPGLDDAIKLAQTLDLSLDWVYLGSLSGTPSDTARMIRAAYLRLWKARN